VAGDQTGKVAKPDRGGIQSAKSFSLWFEDQDGINASAPLSITLIRRKDGAWFFDDEMDLTYAALGGFFPIDGQLFGNAAPAEGVPDHNFHFTVELHATFTWTAGTGRFLEVRADDDLWVFVNDELVIDLGGIHRAKSQFVALDRLGLVDGTTCRLDIFYADRHRMHAKLGIVTNVRDLSSVSTGSGPKTASADTR
jgi:fibro-slime domain-containing protein